MRAILLENGIQPKHQLGQNFLVDNSILTTIAQSVKTDPGSLLVEIGPGLGSLTQKLAEKGARVLAIELDQTLVEVLKKTIQMIYPNLEVIHADARTIDLQKLLSERLAPGQRAQVAANLPYYITTPLIMRLLEDALPLERIVVMVQQEVAERIVSAPGSKNYGALSIAVQYYTEPRIIVRVHRKAFLPSPDVDSAVVEMKMRENPAVDVPRTPFFQVVKAAFGKRRKTLHNALAMGLHTDKQSLHETLTSINIEPSRRGETLSLQELALVTKALLEKGVIGIPKK